MFTLCCLYTNPLLLHKLCDSIRSASFDYITKFIDNSLGNIDSYQAISKFIAESKTRYICIAHQDVDFRSLTLPYLHKQIQKIQLIDSRAALFGCAGISHDGTQGVGHFFDSTGEHMWGFPNNGRVSSLDEFFLVLDREKPVSVTEGLTGFHFYGTDLCVNAARAGYSAYAIDYPVLHNCTPGKIQPDFFEARQRFQTHLQCAMGHGFVKTTCTTLYAGKNHIVEMFVFARSISTLDKPNEEHSRKEMQLAIHYGYSIYGKVLFHSIYLCVSIYHRISKELFPFSDKILHFIHRICSDFSWWSKNWKTRFHLIF